MCCVEYYVKDRVLAVHSTLKNTNIKVGLVVVVESNRRSVIRRYYTNAVVCAITIVINTTQVVCE